MTGMAKRSDADAGHEYHVPIVLVLFWMSIMACVSVQRASFVSAVCCVLNIVDTVVT